MKKLLLASVFIVLHSAGMAQTVNAINAYRHFVVQPAANYTKHTTSITAQVHQFFTQKGAPTYYSVDYLTANGADKCDILLVEYAVQSVKVPGGGGSKANANIKFLNCNYTQVFATQGSAVINNPFDAQKSYEKAIHNALMNLSGYAYNYGSGKSKKNKRKSLKGIEHERIPPDSPGQQVTSQPVATSKSVPQSDVDSNIPKIGGNNEFTYALVIGNEDYSTYQTDLNSEVNVDFAEHDATVFKKYLVRTLGVPDQNITLLKNATAGQMRQSLSKLSKLAEVSGGKAKLIFFYAGHGLPDEKTKAPHLIPVDVSGGDLEYAVKLQDVYQKLTAHPTERVTVFLDACFSGGARNEPLVAMRGVKVRPKTGAMSGNMVVFASSSGDESSATYKKKSHGLFTYFLLKKLQQSKGNTTYKELADYLEEQVKLNAVIINNKVQTPSIKANPELNDSWQQWRLNQ